MTRSFSINPATIKLPLSDKRAGEVTVTVSNQSGAFKKGFVRCRPQGAAATEPKLPDILIDGEKERPFEKGAVQQFKVKVAAKPEVKEGTYQFRLDVANSADPEGDWTEGPVIEITVPKVGVAPAPASGPKWWIFLVIGAAVLLIGGVVLFFVLHSSGGIEVPNLVGMTLEEAEKAAESSGLKAEPAEEHQGGAKNEEKKEDKKSEAAKEDKKGDQREEKKDEKKDEKPRDPKLLKAKVESQDPAAGEKVSSDTVISLVLAKGKEPEDHKAAEIAVPSVKSMSIEQAKLHLFEAGFSPVVGTPEFKGSTPGTIVEQKPAAGAKAEKGSEVTIIPEKENVPLPNLVQRPLKDAIFELNRLKLIGNIVYQTATGPINDNVIDQNPKAGIRVELNSTVTLTVHRGIVFPIIPKEQLHLLQPATARLFAVMNSITGITVTPGSPAYVRRTGLTVSFHYVTSAGSQARLRITALVGGKQVPGSSEPVLQGDAKGNGDAKAVVTFKTPSGVDSIRVTLLGADGKVLDEEHLAVKYTVTPF
jgi:beta-lactam-binding protein with PASTA domain